MELRWMKLWEDGNGHRASCLLSIENLRVEQHCHIESTELGGMGIAERVLIDCLNVQPMIHEEK